MASRGPGRIKLSDAALELGCHIETLRERVRAGRLEAERGPHGAYYVTAAALERMPPIVRASPRRRLTPEELDAGWEAVERLVGLSSRTREAELILLRSLRADPSRSPRLHRLASVQVLERAGLTISEIAVELEITARHVRRLAIGGLSIALRKEIYKQTDRTKTATKAAARRELADIRERLADAGFVSHKRSEKARRRDPFPLDTPENPRQAFVFKKLMASEKSRLRANGITDAQVQAIELVGIGTDELNFLLLRGLPSRPEDA